MRPPALAMLRSRSRSDVTEPSLAAHEPFSTAIRTGVAGGTPEKKYGVVAGLEAHPDIEIRVFNPDSHRSGIHRLGELLTSFTRVNRRMQNKQFIADSAAVVLGGRNIGDEYFSRGELDFQDVDVLVGGPVAQQSAQSFEAYWTSKYAIPIAQLGKV